MFGPVQESPLQSIFLALLLLVLGIAILPLIKSENKKFILGLFSLAFLVRVIATYVTYYYLNAVGGDGFAFMDDRTYDAAGQQIAAAIKMGKDGYELHSWQQNPGYFYLNGFLYSILGTDTFSARILNSFLSALTAVFLFEITRILFSVKIATIAGYLYAFMPSVVYLSSLQFKDTALIFVMVYTVYILVRKNKERITFLSILSVIAALFVMWFLRKDYTLPYIGIVLMWLIMRYTNFERLIERMRKSGLSAFAVIIMLVIGGGVLAGLTSTQAGRVFMERYDRIAGDNKEFVEKASASQIGFSRHLRINSASSLYKLPFAVGFTTILPLPAWGWLTSGENAGAALYSLANLFFIAILPFVLLGFKLTKDIGFANSIMVKWFPILVLIGISIIFMGVLRYKEQLMPFFLMWAAIGLYHRKKHKSFVFMAYVGGGFSVLLAVVFAAMFR